MCDRARPHSQGVGPHSQAEQQTKTSGTKCEKYQKKPGVWECVRAFFLTTWWQILNLVTNTYTLRARCHAQHLPSPGWSSLRQRSRRLLEPQTCCAAPADRMRRKTWGNTGTRGWHFLKRVLLVNSTPDACRARTATAGTTART